MGGVIPIFPRLWIIRAAYTNVLQEPDFRAFYCRAGVSPAIERLTPADETPARHSEVQKQAAFGMTPAPHFKNPNPSQCSHEK